MTDREYADELEKIVKAYEGGEIDRQGWRERMVSLRDKREGLSPPPNKPVGLI